MRHVVHFDDVAETGRIEEEVHEAAIVELHEFLEREAGEELMLGELLGAEPVSVRGHGLFRTLVGRLQDLPRRFGGLHSPVSTRRGGFLQSKSNAIRIKTRWVPRHH